MICYRRLLNISYKDHVNKEDVRRKIQAVIGLVKKWQLRWFGHVSRSSGLAKTILQGAEKRKKKKKETEEEVGRQYYRVDRNELCQLNKGGCLRIQLWCPNHLPRLWDRIEIE